MAKIRYLSPALGEKIGKGCLAKMFSHCKIELIKAFNKISLNGHGGIIHFK